jgi:phosphoserine aminotransferase
MRVHNFGAGPAALPLSVLERMRDELLDYEGSGRSILETSHRSAPYQSVHEAAKERLRALVGGAEDHEILFMTGGARTQFSLVAMNFLAAGDRALYVTTGRWSELALAAARRQGEAREIWSSAETGHDRVPQAGELEPDSGAAYLHYTSNNTIAGTQYRETPVSGGLPLVCDMSSDILSRPLDVRPFGLIYAGAQKNLGPAGVTIVIVRRDMLARAERNADKLPDIMSYALMAAKDSLMNTPPVYAIYFVGLVLGHLEQGGGLEAAATRNQAKADRLYSLLDASDGFYRGHAQPGSRSVMNVTFRLPSAELEARFLERAEAEGLSGLKGHRSVGGIRASLYNAVEQRSVEALAQFMTDFRQRA